MATDFNDDTSFMAPLSIKCEWWEIWLVDQFSENNVTGRVWVSCNLPMAAALYIIAWWCRVNTCFTEMLSKRHQNLNKNKHTNHTSSCSYSRITISRTRIFRILLILKCISESKYILMAFFNLYLVLGTFLQVKITRSANQFALRVIWTCKKKRLINFEISRFDCIP